jgi:hypothetical protein
MSTTSYFAEIVVAGIGGLLVVAGLLMEHFGDRDWYEYKCLPETRSKSLKWIGEWFVIFGVGVEVIVAGLTASAEWQTRQDVMKTAPRNQPLNSITAFVSFEYKVASNVESNEVFDSFFKMYGSSRQPTLDLQFAHFLRVGRLTLKEVSSPEIWRSIGNSTVGGKESLTFSWIGQVPDWDIKFLNGTNATAGDFLDAFNGFIIWTPLQYKTEILGGVMVLSFNSQIRREIPIPPQMVNGVGPMISDESEFYTNTNLFSVWTNWVKQNAYRMYPNSKPVKTESKWHLVIPYGVIFAGVLWVCFGWIFFREKTPVEP